MIWYNSHIVFYSIIQVSGIQDILEVLVDIEQESLTADLSPPETVRKIQNVNTIIQVGIPILTPNPPLPP